MSTLHPECSDKAECKLCFHWLRNMQTALASESSCTEKIHLLSLLPDSFTKNQILLNLDVTKYLVDKSREIKKG